MRTLRSALTKIGLDPELLKHGVRREVFLAPVASNFKEYLRGEADRATWSHFGLDEMAEFFGERWAIPRAGRDDSYRFATRESMRLTTQL
jgi:hypothetical protein